MCMTEMQGKCSRVLKTRSLKNIPLGKRFYVRHMADKYRLSTMGVSKESISKFLIGNRFHVKLRIFSPYSNSKVLAISFHFGNR